jgi:hypothetical protein
MYTLPVVVRENPARCMLDVYHYSRKTAACRYSGYKNIKILESRNFYFPRGRRRNRIAAVISISKCTPLKGGRSFKGEEISAFLICCYAQAFTSILEKDCLPCFL